MKEFSPLETLKVEYGSNVLPLPSEKEIQAKERLRA
jgi:hypothetical protein